MADDTGRTKSFTSYYHRKLFLKTNPFQRNLKDYPDLAIEHGKSIIDQMIKDHTDKPAAMFRYDVGTIEFPWRKEGNPKNSYYGGFGVSHIIAKHGEPVANKVVEVIAESDICKK